MHYIHCHQGVDMKKGGTVGYLSSLLDGMHKIGRFESDQGLRHAFLFPDIGPNDRVPNVPIDMLKYDSPFAQAYEPAPNLKYDNRQQWFHSVMPMSEAMKINLRKVTSVHIHGAYNFLPVYNFLRLCGIEKDVKTILTTHNPWKPELEDVFHLNKFKSAEELQRDLPKEAAYRHYLRMRDDFAFRMSDVLFFPSEHSMDGYYSSWPEFKDIVRNKPVYFSVTGTEPKEVTVPRSAMRQALGIPEGARVFLYLGRFIPMRGFDLYAEVAKKIIESNENAYFLAVGEKRDTPVVDHPRWIEVEHTSTPGDFLNLADACVMANRGSYFDLSMIEALAQGIFLIAAKVGGYKYLEGKTDGVCFFTPESMEGLLDVCNRFCSIDQQSLNKYIASNKELYLKELTPERFAQGYFDSIDNVYSDLSISSRDRGIARLCYSVYPQNLPSKQNNETKIAEKKETIGSKVLLKEADISNISKEELGLAAFKSGQYQKAVGLFYQALEHRPKVPRIRRQLAEALFVTGARSESIKQLELAFEIIPENKNLKKRLSKIRYGKTIFWVKDSPFI